METLEFDSSKSHFYMKEVKHALAADNSLSSWQNDSKTLNKDII